MDKKALIIKDYPFEVEVLETSKENQELYDYFTGIEVFACFGPKKYFLPKNFVSGAADIYKFPLNANDTFLTTFPKSGTTLMQDLVWLLGNNLDYERAKSIPLNERFPFLEISTLMSGDDLPFTEDQKEKLLKSQAPVTLKELKEMPSPRYIITCQVVYVARDPRDVAFSYFNFQKFVKTLTPDKDFKSYWKYFINNKVLWSPYFEHVLEAWDKRNHPNMLFLFYEDIIKDLPAAIRRVADFYGKTLSEEQIDKLAQHLHFDNFKKNKSVNMEDMKEAGIYSSDGAFIRKGKAGGWREHFDEEMTAQADEWIATHLQDTDFRLPH